MLKVSESLISIKIEELEEGGYLATSNILQGLVAQGRTIAETMEIAQDVARKHIESYIVHGDPLPFEIEPSRKVIRDVKIPINETI
ncbi:putative nuclease of the RNAse H fold, HicB family [Methanophagales archaeon]|nr:putative nuclease of the RNAse H fold, HicB family [Methanophagales archaeon]